MITDRYAPEARAAAYLSQQISEVLVHRGHDVSVLTQMPCDYLPDGKSRRPSRTETLNGVAIRRTGLPISCKSCIALRAACQLITALMMVLAVLRAGKPDVIMVYSPPLPVVIAAMVYRLLRNIPYVLNLHDLYPSTAVELGVLRNSILIRLAALLESTAYRHAAQILVAAPRSTSLVADRGRISASKVHFVPNCVNMRESRPGPKNNGFRERHGLSDAFVVVYAGLMGIAQDLETIINCARRMASEKRIVFLMVGDGRNAEKWKAMASDLPNVQFHKPVANQEYMDVLRAADVCLVSLSHALRGPAIPGKMSTIMAVGRPVIAVVPPWSDTVPLIRESKCGLAVTSGDAAELQDAIEAMFNSPGFAEQLGANGFRYAQQNLSLDVVVPQVEEALVTAHRTRLRHSHRTFGSRWSAARYYWRRRA